MLLYVSAQSVSEVIHSCSASRCRFVSTTCIRYNFSFPPINIFTTFQHENMLAMKRYGWRHTYRDGFRFEIKL